MGLSRSVIAAGALAASLLLPGPARAQDASAFGELLKIMKREGMIDESGEQKVMALYAAEQKKSAPKWLEGFEITGDLRARWDAISYDDNSFGGEKVNDQINRSRGRYRARLGITKTFGDYARLGMRLASGNAATTGDRRSLNVSFGEGTNDQFSPDGIFIDRAWLELKPQNSARMQTSILAGRVGNPFVGRVGQDILIFDNDINLEGAYITSSLRATETTRLYVNFGGFAVDENDLRRDPTLLAYQLGVEFKPVKEIALGLRASYYDWRSLNRAIPATPANPALVIDTSLASGNLLTAFDADQARIGDTFAFAQLDYIPNWPIVVYGTFVKNFSADSGVIVAGGSPFAVDSENHAWGLGLELGDATKFVKLGGGFFHVEANSLLSQFTESDLFDGFTNREGWMFYASRKVTPNLELRLTWFDGREIESLGGRTGPFARSLVANGPGGSGDPRSIARRTRLLADAILSF